MQIQIYNTEKPQAIPFGGKMMVPLNVTEDISYDEDGNEVKGYRADWIEGVESPVTVDNIVDAAIKERYDSAAQLRIMRNISKTKDPEIKAYKAYIDAITKSAKEEGYE